MKFNLKRKVLITTAVTTTLLTGFDDKQDGNKFINKNPLEAYSKDNNGNKDQC
ncbi:hypothetical protein [Romboutsia sp. 1001713B170131_170501_G6]|uniref:hypothetical protein n=1 Tax=Romboutsia sp. 1001713B170131_170501_G6 TaxID=2787108 RepID=UPI0018AB07D4|nr:hypothetical protein [Romboutsia sp. 1001713B170131_170501_G6]